MKEEWGNMGDTAPRNEAFATGRRGDAGTGTPRSLAVSPRLRVFASFLFCLWFIAHSLALAAPAEYAIADLGPGLVRAIAPTTTLAVGTVTVSGHQVAATLAPGATVPLALLPDGLFSNATGAAGSATVVGYASTGPASAWTHAVRWVNGTPTDLGTTAGPDLSSFATNLNATGDIVGYGDTPDGAHLLATVWRVGQPTVQLTTLGGTRGSAIAINDVGDIAGYSSTAGNRTHATLWRAGTAIDLHTSDGLLSFALGLNNPGQVVGYTMTSQGDRGFIWIPLTGMLLLPPVPGDTMSTATGINDEGIVVGQSWTPDTYGIRPFSQVAAVRWVNGQVEDLNTPLTTLQGWVLELAVSINQAGVIVGAGTLYGVKHSWMLTPVATADLAATNAMSPQMLAALDRYRTKKSR